MTEPVLQKKICMLGGFSVGKTSLVKRFVASVFSEAYLTTVGVKIDKKTVHLGERAVNLILWDVAGEDGDRIHPDIGEVAAEPPLEPRRKAFHERGLHLTSVLPPPHQGGYSLYRALSRSVWIALHLAQFFCESFSRFFHARIGSIGLPALCIVQPP